MKLIIVKKNLHDEDRKFASWDHIITAYEIDAYSLLLERYISNITEQHVYPDKVKKMKVKLMVQIFTKKMYQFIDLLAITGGKFRIGKLHFLKICCKTPKTTLISNAPIELLKYPKNSII